MDELQRNFPTHGEVARVFTAAPAFSRRWGVEATQKWLRSHSMGSGGYARVYELSPERVIKVTDDDGDAEAAMLALKITTPVGIPAVDEVVVSHAIKGHPYYAIVMEQVLPMDDLDGDMREEAEAVLGVLEQRTVSGARKKKGRAKKRGPAPRLGKWGKKWLKELREASAWVERHMGRKFTDIHPGNVGLRVSGDDLQAVILDLGEASWGRGVEGIQEAS